MRLGLVVSVTETSFEAVALRGDWRTSIRLAGALGYDGVELAIRDPSLLDATEVAQLIRSLGLQVAAVGTGQAFLQEGLTLTSEDPSVRSRAIERLEHHLTFAASLGAPVIVGLMYGRLAGGRSATDARLVSAFEQLLPYAERTGMRLLLEPINRYETDYLNTIDQVLAVIERVHSPALGVLADLFHMNIEEASINVALRRGATRLGHVHVADSNRQAPGRGHLDFAGILSVLTDVGYQGYLSAEILPLPDPESAAKLTLQYLRPLLTRVDGRSELDSRGKEERP
jgi:sugar phosphate isomerase/epimerase